MPVSRRGFVPLLFVAALLLPAAVPVAASTDPSVTGAEAAALTYANKERAERGLRPLRLDGRLQVIAHDRAETMSSENQLSHDQADGNNVFDLLTAAGITRYGAGEIIAYNYTSGYTASASAAIQQWIKSSAHYAILMSANYNYVAFGMAANASGRRYWSGVFIKGPDRTAAWVKLSSPTKQYYSSTRTRVIFRWSGADTVLQVLTSGLRYYEIGRRSDGGDWVSYPATRNTSLSTTWPRGHTYQFRVRTLDWAGNRSGWKTVTVTL